jgi:hypothetical protein
VLARFNDREGSEQVVESVRVEHALQFLMHGILGAGRDSKEQNARRVPSGEHETPKVPVPRQQKTGPLGSFPQEPAVWCSGQVEASSRDHVVPVRSQEIECDRPYVVVSEKGHDAGADT